MNWNIIGRLCIVIIGCLIWGYVAFKQTPELDGIKNAWIYRTSYFALLLRGWMFILLNMANLFPL